MYCIGMMPFQRIWFHKASDSINSDSIMRGPLYLSLLSNKLLGDLQKGFRRYQDSGSQPHFVLTLLVVLRIQSLLLNSLLLRCPTASRSAAAHCPDETCSPEPRSNLLLYKNAAASRLRVTSSALPDRLQINCAARDFFIPRFSNTRICFMSQLL